MYKETFFRDLYLQTNGWIPMNPFHQKIHLGDFFQIQNQHVKTLGNIQFLRDFDGFDSNEEILFLEDHSWKSQSGVEQAFSEVFSDVSSSGDHSNTSKYIYDFKRRGSYLFYANKPSAAYILNWSEIKKKITLHLTQTEYSFREVYVITAVAESNSWGLAIAGRPDAQLELISRQDEHNMFNLFGSEYSEAGIRKNLCHYEKHKDKPIYFFKAKRLILSDEKQEHIQKKILKHSDTENVNNWFNGNLFNHIDPNELNISNCLHFFDWIDTNLDDLERLC